MQAAAGFVVRDVQPARRQRARQAWGQAIIGPQAPARARHRLGQRRRRRRARRARRGPRRATRSATATGSACSAAATAATWPRCSPAATASGSAPSAASGRSTTCSPRSGRSDIGTAFKVEHGPTYLDDPEEYAADVADPSSPRHRRADAAAPLRERPALPDHPGRGAVHGAAPARQGRDVLPLPRRGPRADPQSGSPVHRRSAPRSSSTGSPRSWPLAASPAPSADAGRDRAGSAVGRRRASRRSACGRSRCRGGIGGSSSRRYQLASTISVGSSTMSPDTWRARKPNIRLCGNGHGWLPW